MNEIRGYRIYFIQFSSINYFSFRIFEFFIHLETLYYSLFDLITKNATLNKLNFPK